MAAVATRPRLSLALHGSAVVGGLQCSEPQLPAYLQCALAPPVPAGQCGPPDCAIRRARSTPHDLQALAHVSCSCQLLSVEVGWPWQQQR